MLQVSPIFLTVLGSFITLLLAIIAFFLKRLLAQFDELKSQFITLNSTMLRIDLDVKGQFRLLEQEAGQLNTRVENLEPLEDRLAAIEIDLALLKQRCPRTPYNNAVCAKGD